MRTIKSSEIARIINEAYDGVEKSKIGQINVRDEKGNIKLHGDHNTPIMNTVAANTFLSVLNNILPKDIGARMEIKDEHDI